MEWSHEANARPVFRHSVPEEINRLFRSQGTPATNFHAKGSAMAAAVGLGEQYHESTVKLDMSAVLTRSMNKSRHEAKLWILGTKVREVL